MSDTRDDIYLSSAEMILDIHEHHRADQPQDELIYPAPSI